MAPREADHLRFAVGSADRVDRAARKEAARGSSPLPSRSGSVRDPARTRDPGYGIICPDAGRMPPAAAVRLLHPGRASAQGNFVPDAVKERFDEYSSLPPL